MNFFQAAGHVHRFLTLDENVLRMSAGANEGLSIAFCVNSSLQPNLIGAIRAMAYAHICVMFTIKVKFK